MLRGEEGGEGGGAAKSKTSKARSSINHSILQYTANDRPVRIQYKCLVPIYVFPEMKLHTLIISQTEL
jgi:hypothetical protein